MPLHQAINSLKANIPSSRETAQKFLDTLSPSIQQQLIAAIYLGREHIQSSKLRKDEDIEMSRSYTDHIEKDEYANILWEKGDNVITYLNKLEECANASGFDLNQL